MAYSLSLTPLADFQPAVIAAGCYCEFEDKVLFLKRHPAKAEGNTWGVPGGKLDSSETPEDAAIREAYEEVGLAIPKRGLEDIGKVYVRRDNTDIVFYRFRYRFLTLPVVKLALDEHVDFRWVTLDAALGLPLIAGGKEALELYRDYVQSPESKIAL